MGIAALVLGILSMILGFVPFCNVLAIIPAIVGLILGIVEIVKKKKSGEPRGLGIAGTVLSGLAIVVIIIVFGVAFSGTMTLLNYAKDGAEEYRNMAENYAAELNDYDYYYDYDY